MSLERHRDVGAYALGVLDEAEAFHFEDHLMDCPRCTSHVAEFGPVTRQLMLYRRATPRLVNPAARPGPRLLDGLLGEVGARRRARRRRTFYAVAATVVAALAGPWLTLAAVGGSPDRPARIAATDARSGVWAQVTAEDAASGSRVELKVKDGAGPRTCRLVAVGHDGSEQTLATWAVRRHDAGETTVEGSAALHPDQIDRYEVRAETGERLVVLDPPS